MMKWEREEAWVLIIDVTDCVAEQTNSEGIFGDTAGDGWGLFFRRKI